jgi:hypothetical protein
MSDMPMILDNANYPPPYLISLNVDTHTEPINLKNFPLIPSVGDEIDIGGIWYKISKREITTNDGYGFDGSCSITLFAKKI